MTTKTPPSTTKHQSISFIIFFPEKVHENTTQISPYTGSKWWFTNIFFIFLQWKIESNGSWGLNRLSIYVESVCNKTTCFLVSGFGFRSQFGLSEQPLGRSLADLEAPKLLLGSFRMFEKMLKRFCLIFLKYIFESIIDHTSNWKIAITKVEISCEICFEFWNVVGMSSNLVYKVFVQFWSWTISKTRRDCRALQSASPNPSAATRPRRPEPAPTCTGDVSLVTHVSQHVAPNPGWWAKACVARHPLPAASAQGPFGQLGAKARASAGQVPCRCPAEDGADLAGPRAQKVQGRMSFHAVVSGCCPGCCPRKCRDLLGVVTLTKNKGQ